MKKQLWAGLIVFLLVPFLALAQSAFDGTWKVDLSNVQMPKKPDVYLLQKGMYQCKTCAPPINVKADGTDQKVAGNPYLDTTSVKVVDDHTIERENKKQGKSVGTSKMTVAPDGNTASLEFTDSSATNSEPVTGKGEYTRVDKGPAGSHAISGSWRATKMDNVSDNGLTFTYKVDGDSLSMSTPTGQSFTAKLDGRDSPYKGDPGTTSVSLKQPDKNTLEETDKRDSTVIFVSRSTVAADGKSMKIESTDKLRGTTTQFTAVKQ